MFERFTEIVLSGLKIFSILTLTFSSLSLIAAHIFLSLGLTILNKSMEVWFKSIFVPVQPILYRRYVLLYFIGLKAPMSK